MKRITFFLPVIVGLILSVLTTTSVDAQAINKTDSMVVKTQKKSKALVISARSLKRNREPNSAVLGDFIELRINSIDYLLGPNDTCCLSMADTLIFLSLNGMPNSDIHALSFNRTTNSVIFHLERNSNSLKRISQQVSYPWDIIELSSISICVKGNPPLPTSVTKFMLHYTSPRIFLLSIVFVLMIIVVYIILVKYTNFIRVEKENSPFSLAQSQMAFWTLLVSSSVVYIWLTTDNLPDLTSSTLTLMGISLATIAGGKAVPYFKKEIPPAVPKTEGFWRDILSDSSSVTIHRFQMVLWTIILGFIYVQKVIFYQQIPEFSNNYLLLTGLSSGTYILLKTVESRDSKDTNDKVIQNGS